jgi:uncharacterized SAM-binding protein YcdF (DUF218 family)
MKRDFAGRTAHGIVAACFPDTGRTAVTNQGDRLPTEAEIAAINARHLVETPLQPADLLFVFGTRQDVDARVAEAARLWRGGYFRWAIVSGGITPGAKLSEAKLSECAIITDAMIARGVPAGIILKEDRAMNTGENVIFSLPIIDAAIGLKNISSVICLGNTWTARRYPMTLHRHWPDVEKMLVMVDSFETPRSRWHTNPEFSRRMLGEWDKIEPYKARGFIAEWPVRDERER